METRPSDIDASAAEALDMDAALPCAGIDYIHRARPCAFMERDELGHRSPEDGAMHLDVRRPTGSTGGQPRFRTTVADIDGIESQVMRSTHRTDARRTATAD